jgi:hypothetical protein
MGSTRNPNTLLEKSANQFDLPPAAAAAAAPYYF